MFNNNAYRPVPSSTALVWAGDPHPPVPRVTCNAMPFSLQLKPIISDPEYLLDQHILISIKSSDSDESYGKGPWAGTAAAVSWWPLA